MQVPSKVSAIKIDGVRSYTRAREGEDFEIPARPVTVSSFTVRRTCGRRHPVLDLVVSVVCSSGTYIRALARDLGAELGVGGHLTALRRTRVGPYKLDGARTLDQLAGGPRVMPIADAAAAAFPRWDVDADAGPAAGERRTHQGPEGARPGRRLRPRRALPGPGGGARGPGPHRRGLPLRSPCLRPGAAPGPPRPLRARSPVPGPPAPRVPPAAAPRWLPPAATIRSGASPGWRGARGEGGAHEGAPSPGDLGAAINRHYRRSGTNWAR